MTLETLITDLTKAVEANTKAIEEQTSFIQGAAKKVRSDEPAKKPTTRKKAAAKKDETTTIEDVRTRFGDFLKGAGHEIDKSDKETIRGVVQHILEEIGADRVGEIEEADFDRALKLLKPYEDKLKEGPGALRDEPEEEDLKKAFGAYLQLGEDDDEKTRLAETIRPILDHFGVARVSQISDDDADEAKRYLAKLEAGHADEGVSGAESVDLELGNESGDADDDVL